MKCSNRSRSDAAEEAPTLLAKKLYLSRRGLSQGSSETVQRSCTETLPRVSEMCTLERSRVEGEV